MTYWRALSTLVAAGAWAAARADVAEALDCGLPDAHLHVRLEGAISEELDWNSPALACDGMPRADGGFRLRFAGAAANRRLDVLLGVPSLAAGRDGRAVPVNLTIIAGDGRIYGTLGPDRCLLDEVRQTLLPATNGERRWRVEARGFCLDPARALGGTDAVLATTFELTGLIVSPDEAEVPR